jgi:hypothetical protein
MFFFAGWVGDVGGGWHHYLYYGTNWGWWVEWMWQVRGGLEMDARERLEPGFNARSLVKADQEGANLPKHVRLVR